MTSLFCLPPSFVRATLAVASLLSLPACKSTTGAAGSNSDSLYASNYANDGGYRPYGSGGAVQTSPVQSPASAGSSAYGRSVPPPPPGYEMPKEEEFHSPPASTSSSSSGSTAKKSTASKSSGSTAKKKTSTAATKKKNASPRTHTVVKGDTLYGLALRHKTTVAKIKAASGISSDKLSIGQKLRLP